MLKRAFAMGSSYVLIVGRKRLASMRTFEQRWLSGIEQCYLTIEAESPMNIRQLMTAISIALASEAPNTRRKP